MNADLTVFLRDRAFLVHAAMQLLPNGERPNLYSLSASYAEANAEEGIS